MDSLIYVTSNGATFNWVVQASNNGPSIATNVLIENSIPVGVSIVGFESSKGERVTGTDNFRISSLLSKETVTITLNMQVDDIALAPFDLTSYISSDQLDRYQLNNDLSAQVVDTCSILDDCQNSGINNMSISAAKDSDFIAQLEYSYPIDVTNGPVVVDMPATAATGDRIEVWDYEGNSSTNNITLNFNGNHLNNQGMILSGLFDGDLGPKAIEVYITKDIADLSAYGLGISNNGAGSPGVQYNFPAVSASAGTFLYLTNDNAAFNTYFGFSANYEDAFVNMDGNDSIELFLNSDVIDVFGDPNVNGVGNVWEYTDSWAYRISQTPSLTVSFIASDWNIAAIDENDGVTQNSLADDPFPHGEYFASKIAGEKENKMIIDMDNANVLFTYQGADLGWKYIVTNLTNIFV